MGCNRKVDKQVQMYVTNMFSQRIESIEISSKYYCLISFFYIYKTPHNYSNKGFTFMIFDLTFYNKNIYRQNLENNEANS